MTIQDYLSLITSEYQQQPKFMEMIAQFASATVQLQNNSLAANTLYDLSTPPAGEQLDVIGQWVGISRDIAVPLTGVFFTWDGSDPSVGWNLGSWQPPGNPTQITSLPDDAYLTLIRGKIAANAWDGTTNGAYKIWDTIFPDFTILIQDLQNMSYQMAIVGGIVDSVTLALLVNGLIPLKPEGVMIGIYYASIDANPVFGWDVESTSLAGWNEGSWVRELIPA